MVSSSRISTMLLTAVSMPNSSAIAPSRMMTRTFLPGKLPHRKVQRSRHNSSTRVCSTRHRARLSSLPLLPNLLPQPLSSTKVSGASTPYRAEPTSSLSGRKAATRAIWRLASPTQRATRFMQKHPSMPRWARSGPNIQLNSQPMPTMRKHSLNS